MVILGVNDSHNASAALMVDGRLVAAVSEDRIVRKTLRSGFPAKSIERCLAIGGYYMTLAFDTTALGKEAMVCGLHPYDCTSRPHTVTKENNPGYHALISAFENVTGVGALLNTSFNLHGEPIVETPEDAVSTFARSGLPHLYIEGWLLSKKEYV